MINNEESTPDRNSAQIYLAQAITAFRLGMDAQGNDNLKELIDIIVPYFNNKETIIGEIENQLIDAILSAQSRSDSAYLADLLEYEFPNTELGKMIT